MTEQAIEDLQTIYEAPTAPLNMRHVLKSNWVIPARTLTLGAILSILLILTLPINSFTYVAILLPICFLTAVTQLSLGVIHELDEHNQR